MKIYIVAGVIIASIWIISFTNLLQLGIVGYFLLIIFTVLFGISVFSKGPGPGRSGEDESAEFEHW
ncbi:MAG: hypothetical protein KGY66_02860 [Candidatus Thermoplasmatota archaeon]|nr:hypothetical protein [Candidatus Thermoplasmatota archaeon]MBS3789835.1 hypothetical protein [Candidatus Thermoplasmatota archaeon]